MDYLTENIINQLQSEYALMVLGTAGPAAELLRNQAAKIQQLQDRIEYLEEEVVGENNELRLWIQACDYCSSWFDWKQEEETSEPS